MMTAHVNEEAIVLRFESVDNLSHQGWEILLDQLRSEHIPSLYRNGKRSHASFEARTGKTLVVIYFTPKMVTVPQAKDILMQMGIDVQEKMQNQ